LLHYQIIAVLIGTVANVTLSWRTLRNPRCHGFYRFFVFELELILVVLNFSVWFKNPFSLQQIFSWILLSLSIYYAVSGFYLLRKIGKADPAKMIETNFPFENTGNLVRVGLYKFIRHPMYGSLLFLAWGAFLKFISIITTICAVLCTLFVFLTAKIEEKENMRSFGKEYERYREATKMFIPYVW
jgi:protein-S-isoprenylcysteine O-methyltransferase Ste14